MIKKTSGSHAGSFISGSRTHYCCDKNLERVSGLKLDQVYNRHTMLVKLFFENFVNLFDICTLLPHLSCLCFNLLRNENDMSRRFERKESFVLSSCPWLISFFKTSFP